MSDNTVKQDDVQADTPPVNPPRKKSSNWELKLLLLGLFLFVAGEVGLRIFADYDSKFNVFIGAGKEWDPGRRVRLKKNYESGVIKTNSKGILGAEFEAKKPEGGFRILNIGDSCSFFPPERNYSMVMQEKLRESMPCLLYTSPSPRDRG